MFSSFSAKDFIIIAFNRPASPLRGPRPRPFRISEKGKENTLAKQIMFLFRSIFGGAPHRLASQLSLGKIKVGRNLQSHTQRQRFFLGNALRQFSFSASNALPSEQSNKIIANNLFLPPSSYNRRCFAPRLVHSLSIAVTMIN